jgi:dienelactone hydrolase
MSRWPSQPWLALLALAAAALIARPAAAADDAPLARDLHEQLAKITVSVSDLHGRRETKEIPVTIFRPDGSGPFPLVIMNHGRATAAKRAAQKRQRFEGFSRYMVAKGFVVMLPTRVGYADTYGDFDPEAIGACRDARLDVQATAASDQVLATLAFAKTLPYVDASRWIVAGQSVGGVATLATAWRHPAGLVGAINFAGGTGGDPDLSPGRPCHPERLAEMWRSNAGKSQGLPTLWLYWANDEFWGPDNPKLWVGAWVTGGGQAEFHRLAPAGKTGHGAMNFDMDHWVPYAEAFLAKLGFGKSGVIARPPASNFADIGDAEKVPITPRERDTLYRSFLAQPKPRAFAIGADGAAGYAFGDWAMGRALGFCQQRRGAPCKLYAVDDDVVWAR